MKLEERKWLSKDNQRLESEKAAKIEQDKQILVLLEKQSIRFGDYDNAQYKIITKLKTEIREKPVYRNVCISSDGMLRYNELVDKANAARKRSGALPSNPTSGRP